MIDKGVGTNSNFNGLADNNSPALNTAVDNMEVNVSEFKRLLKYVEPNNYDKGWRSC